MSIPSFLLILVGSINLFLSYIVFYKSKSKKDNVFFSLMTFSIAIWAFSIYFFRILDDYNIVMIFARIVYASIASTAFWFLFFSVYFFKKIKKFNKFCVFLFLSFFVFIFFSSLFGNFIIEGIEIKNGVNSLLYGFGNNIYGFYFILYFSLGYFFLFLKYKKYTGVIKAQLKYIILGSSISLLISIGVNFILTYLGDFRFNWIGPVSTIVLASFTFYAITCYRLMGIRVVLSNVFIYTVLVLLTEICFYFYLVISTALFKDLWSLQSLFLNIFVSIFFVFLFIRILRYSRIASDVIFYHGKNPQHLMGELVFEFNQIVDINKLSKLLEKKLNQILETKKVSTVFCLYKEKNLIKIFNKKNFPKLTFKEMSAIKSYLEKNRKIIVREELENSKKVNQKGQVKIINLLNKYKISIVVPLEYHKDIIGYILLGDKEDFEFFASEEISFLDTFSKQIASSFMDAYLYSNMKKEVARQTKKLKEKNEHLKKLLQMRSEFLDIVSHQLRTPVSVIKGMLSMVIEGSVPPEKRQEFIEGSFKKSIKLGQIINDILRASEIDTDEEFKLKLIKTDIKPILQDIYEDKKLELEDKNLKFKLDISKKLPMILTEEPYLRQVIENLINNSIQYTKKGYIKLSAKEEDNFVVIRISDTGIGIPKTDKQKLFRKFSRANNAVNVYTDGSGLGLFIAKKIIDAHHNAKIYIEKSKLNKGTTFAIKIPAVK